MLSIWTGEPDSLHTLRGHEELKTMERNNLNTYLRENPHRGPSDRNKLPDLVDFCVTKGIPQDFAVAKPCFHLPFPILITRTAHALN
jgi:hypothetical protein